MQKGRAHIWETTRCRLIHIHKLLNVPLCGRGCVGVAKGGRTHHRPGEHQVFGGFRLLVTAHRRSFETIRVGGLFGVVSVVQKKSKLRNRSSRGDDEIAADSRSSRLRRLIQI